MADIDDTDADLPEKEEEGAEGGEEAPPKKEAPTPAPDEKGEEGAEEEESDEDDPSKSPVPVRSSAVASHIIARQKKKIDDLRKEKPSDEEEGTDEEDGEEASALSAEAQRAIQSGISKAIAPLTKRLASDSDEKELGTLFTAVPEAKRYEKRIRAFMSHDGYKQVPPEFIFQALAFKDAEKIGASKKINADREAGHSRTGGHPLRKKSSPSSISAEGIKDMDDKEFEKLQSKVMTGH